MDLIDVYLWLVGLLLILDILGRIAYPEGKTYGARVTMANGIANTILAVLTFYFLITN